MGNHVARVGLVALSLILLQTAVRAEVVFEQLPDPGLYLGLSSDTDPSGTIGRRSADDFTLSSASVIRQIDWWGKYYEGFSGTEDFVFRIYANGTGGVPGVQLLETRGAVASTPDPEIESLIAYRAALNASFAAQAGETYWLAIYNARSSVAWGWDNSKEGNNISAQTFVPPDSEWTLSPGTNVDNSFRLSTGGAVAIPLPPALIPGVISFALAAICVYRARRIT